MNRRDPHSWYEKSVGKGIMMEFYHHPTLAKNRRSPHIYKAFSQIWQTAELWTTTDRTSFNPLRNSCFNTA